ncbi:MAG: transposase, partial [Caldisphaeraceae archaeon]|nr:transposase [Caldisphaeraceae archaeon]
LSIRNMVKVGNKLAQHILDASWGKFLRMLSYKAESAGKRVIKVNPRGTSEGLTINDPYRDYISACRIKNRSGLGRSSEPVERKPLLLITAKAVIEGHVSSMKQEAPHISGG